MPRLKVLALVNAIVFLSGSNLFASKILLIAGDDAANTAMMRSVLQAQGNDVVTGVPYTSFTGSGLAGSDAVLLLPNGTYWSGKDMPASGQHALLDFVKNGGGLVTSEATAAMVEGVGGQGVFRTLAQALPMYPTEVQTFNTPVVMTSQTNDPILNAALPKSFGVPANANDTYYTESYFKVQPGATSFFSTNQWTETFGGYGVGSAVAGWSFGQGRVLSLSTFSDNTALGDRNYEQLLGNSVNWVTQPHAVPEPGTVLILGLGSAVLLLRRHRVSQGIRTNDERCRRSPARQ
jgi:hypothetical protein